jgi:hypothetical protein
MAFSPKKTLKSMPDFGFKGLHVSLSVSSNPTLWYYRLIHRAKRLPGQKKILVHLSTIEKI